MLPRKNHGVCIDGHVKMVGDLERGDYLYVKP